MKILYSQLKELVPKLKADAQEVGNTLSMIGFLMDGLEEVSFGGKKDQMISLEVRQNRADCLSVIGLAREVSAYYGLAMKMPASKSLSFGKDKLGIKVDAKEYVKRILAVQVDGLKNKPSPNWLKEFLALYEMNSVDMLVDISNYVMLYTGYTSHLLDKDKVTGDAQWEINCDFKKIITLDGTEVKLDQGDELMIRDDKNPLALAGIVGGKAAAVGVSTKSIIAEMAIYDRTIIRQNSRSLKVVTEASSRLEKDMDPNGADEAFVMLISMILENCGGSIASQQFDYYPKPRTTKAIEMELSAPSTYAGVEIKKNKVFSVLKDLRFEVTDPSPTAPKGAGYGARKGDKILATPPTDRMDIELMEDVVEEVVRMYGYQNIPSEKAPDLMVAEDITSPVVTLSEKIRDIMSISGFDEILSQPLVQDGINAKTNYLDWKEIVTQNAVNDKYPNLRQSIAVGLLNQKEIYLKKNVEQISIFEIGVIFGKRGGKFLEHDSFGVLISDASNKAAMAWPKTALENLLRYLGLTEISYEPAKAVPEVANPYSCWDVMIGGIAAGIIYKMKPEVGGATYFFELNLDALVELMKKLETNPVVEITHKLMVLDANVEMATDKSVDEFMEKAKKEMGAENIFSLAVKDVFPIKGKKKVRYTFRAVYKGLSDQDAKEIHAQAFGLK